MIIFESIQWRNFLSTGQHSIKINLNNETTTLIVGSNGSGKSTILDALCFSLYGKSFRGINKIQLVNSINEKDCVVEIEFTINRIKWKIIRGIKPNIFKIYRNGEELHQHSSMSDQQKWLEQNILKMNYKSFTQIVILGSSTFVPFMQLTSSSRREVVEDLLDITIFSSMNLVIKEKIRNLKEQIKTLELKRESFNDKVSMQKSFIEELKNRGKYDIKEKENRIQEILNLENSYINKNEKNNNKVKTLQESLKLYDGSKDKLREYGSIKGKLLQKISIICKEQEFFSDNSVCPTCNQDIEESFRVN